VSSSLAAEAAFTLAGCPFKALIPATGRLFRRVVRPTEVRNPPGLLVLLGDFSPIAGGFLGPHPLVGFAIRASTRVVPFRVLPAIGWLDPRSGSAFPFEVSCRFVGRSFRKSTAATRPGAAR
jgi:hypothetical protein